MQHLTGPTTQHLNVIRAISNVIYLAGDDGYLYRGDPRFGFQSIELPTNTTVWDILKHGNYTFIFGEEGTIYRSNFGDDWVVKRQGDPGQQFHHAKIDGNNRIWALGSNVGPYVSADEGENWFVYDQFGGTSVSGFYSIEFFPTARRGYIATGVQAFRTYDNGNLWNGPIAIEAIPNDILFFSADELMMGCSNGTILRSYNFGGSWERANIPALVSERINRIIEVPNDGYVAISAFYINGDERHGRIWQSFDRQNWFLIADIDHEIRDIAVEPTQGIFVCGTDGFFGKLAH